MFELIVSSIYFILPAYIANMAPVFAARLGLPLGLPIHKRLFGAHKSWRGFYSAYVLALISLSLQYWLQYSGHFYTYNLLNYEQINIFLYAFLFGVGALTGDLIKSFFKRRTGITAGASWFPFDQLDLVIGALIFLAPFFILPWQNIITLLILTPLLHFTANLLGYFLKLKEVWW